MLAGFGSYNAHFGPNFMYTASLLAISGFHLLVFGLLAKYYAHLADPVFRDPRVGRLAAFFTVERGLTTGASLLAIAVALAVPVLVHWWRTAEVPLPGQWIFAGTLFCLGLEAMAASFLVGILDMPRRPFDAERPMSQRNSSERVATRT
jgi:hypothetical protein